MVSFVDSCQVAILNIKSGRATNKADWWTTSPCCAPSTAPTRIPHTLLSPTKTANSKPSSRTANTRTLPNTAQTPPRRNPHRANRITATSPAPTGFDAANLEAGHKLIDDSGNWQTVVSVRVEPKPLNSYNLEVENDHTFFIRGLSGDAGIWVP